MQVGWVCRVIWIMFEHFLTWQSETDHWPGNPLGRNLCWYVPTKSRADCWTQMTLLCQRSAQGSPASNWLQSNSWSLKTCCLPAGSPRRQMYFSCPLNCFGWSFALIESRLIIRVLFDNDCILLAVDINRWSLSVLFWTLNSRFLAGWFSLAEYLLSHRPGLSQEIKTWE